MIAPAQIDLLPEIPLTPGEVEAWQPRENLTISQWGEKHYVVTEGDWKGSLLNLDQTPYLRYPMDAWGRPGLKVLIIIGPNQGGKSLIMYVCWAYGQHQKNAIALMVLADEKLAGEVASERLAEIVRQSPALSKIATGSPMDLGQKKVKLQSSLTRMGWPRSEATMQVFSYPEVYEDEMRLYAWDGKAMDPIAQGLARVRAYKYSGRVMGGSTVGFEADFAWTNLVKCEVINAYMAKCPACGQLQIMKVEQLRWDEELDGEPDRIQAGNLAWYECEHCLSPWGEAERRRAVRDGDYGPHRWDSKERWFYPVPPVPDATREGIHFSAFYLPSVTLGEIAALAIKAKSDPEAEQELYQSYLAIPRNNERAPRQEDSILRLCDDRHPELPGIVPSEATHLVATVDCHETGFWYVMRAFAPGPERESWLVRFGFIQGNDLVYPAGWAGLAPALFDSLPLNARGEQVPIVAGLVDSGHATNQAYDWCAAHPPFLPSKGHEKLEVLHRTPKVDSHPGLVRVSVNTTVYKNTLAAKLMVNPGDPGAFHLFTNRYDAEGPPEKDNLGRCAEYARHMCSEAPNKAGRWEPIGKRPNHLWDCEVLTLVCCNLLGLPNMPKPGEEPKPKLKKEKTKPRRNKRW